MVVDENEIIELKMKRTDWRYILEQLSTLAHFNDDKEASEGIEEIIEEYLNG